MEYSDEQTSDVVRNGETTEDNISVDVDTVSDTMPKIVPNPQHDREDASTPKPKDGGVSFAGELVSVVVKTLFTVLSFVALLTCVLAVALPLNSMRIFNSLGMSERAVDFGERYVSGRLNDYDAAGTDERGNYNKLSRTAELTDDEMTEALYVCIGLSDKLMDEGYKNGDTARGIYYAERLEKYTRMYLSLNGLSRVMLDKNNKNIASMPTPALHPAVYSFENTLHKLNFKARAYLGKTDLATYNNRSDMQGVMTTVSTLGRSFYGSAIPDDVTGKSSRLDDFTDYMGQIGEYLDVEFEKLGVVHDFSKRYTVTVTTADGKEQVFHEVPIVSETFVRNTYAGKLDGDEFSLFLTPLDKADGSNSGFTVLYNQLKTFARYAQLAVDTVPLSGTSNTEALLHQVYWLQTLTSVAQKLQYMELLLYYSAENLGVNAVAIRDEYGAMAALAQVQDSAGTQCQISDVYAKKLKQYISQYQS